MGLCSIVELEREEEWNPRCLECVQGYLTHALLNHDIPEPGLTETALIGGQHTVEPRCS